MQELVTKVLPHALVRVMEEIHVSWQGVEKPTPNDPSGLLSVQRQVVKRALVWLKKDNPRYADIEIGMAEPTPRGPSAGIRAYGENRTVGMGKDAGGPGRSASRAWDGWRGSMETGEMLAALEQGKDAPAGTSREPGQSEANGEDGGPEAESEHSTHPINEVASKRHAYKPGISGRAKR